MSKPTKQRTCIVCRCVRQKEDMLRFAVFNEELLIDKDFKASGRGAYVCSKKCLQGAGLNARIQRALKTRISEQRLQELLNLCKSNNTLIGD